MTRERYRDDGLGTFSEWHRDELPSWYKHIDIDYVAYAEERTQDDTLVRAPYAILEIIHCKREERVDADTPKRYPIDTHKRQLYDALAAGLDILVGALWVDESMDSFVVCDLDDLDDREDNEALHVFDTQGAFLDFLDSHRRPIEHRIAESTDDSLAVGAPAPAGTDTGWGTS